MTVRHLGVPAPVTLVIGTAPTISNTTTQQGSTPADATVTTPTGTGGIFVFMVSAFNPTTATAGAVTPTGGTGTWTRRSYATGGTEIATWVFTKPAAGEGGTMGFTSTAGGVFHAAICTRIVHGSGTPVYDTAGTPNSSPTATALQFPAVTTANAARLIGCASSGLKTFSAPGDGFTSVATSTGQAMYQRAVTPNGTYGPSSLTLSGAGTSTVHTIAIGPP